MFEPCDLVPRMPESLKKWNTMVEFAKAVHLVKESLERKRQSRDVVGVFPTGCGEALALLSIGVTELGPLWSATLFLRFYFVVVYKWKVEDHAC